MKIVITAMLLVAVVALASCSPSSQAPERPIPATAGEPIVISGVVTGISSTHGNVYTSIRPDQYESLGLVAGNRVVVVFAGQELTLPIGSDYADVPTGTPLAVLHREGLTFAIRDGDFSRTYGIRVGMQLDIAVAAPQ